MADRISQRGTSKTSQGRFFRLPTPKSPVVTKRNAYTTAKQVQAAPNITSVAQPRAAQAAVTESGQRGAFDLSATAPTPRALSREEFGSLSAAQTRKLPLEDVLAAQRATADRFRAPGSDEPAGGRIVSQEELDLKRIEEIKANLLTEEQRIRRDVEASFAPQFSAARRSGAQAKESAFRIQGRAAEGTKSATQQEDLATRQGEIEQSIAAQQRLQERRLIAQARGASKEEMDSINQGIQQARAVRKKAEDELALRQAGLDESAVKMANDREKQTMKDALEAAQTGFILNEETGTYEKDPSFTEPGDFDFKLQTDDQGNVTQIRTNKGTGDIVTTSLGSLGKTSAKARAAKTTSRAISRGVSPGAISGLSSRAKSIFENPDLLNSYTPTERGKVLDELAGAGKNLARFTLNDVSASQRNKITEFDTLEREARSALDQIVLLDTGPIASRVARAQALIGGAGEFTIYRSSLDNLGSTLLKARSGGAVTPQEFERLSGFIPGLNDDEKTAKLKLDRLATEIGETKTSFVQNATATENQLIEAIDNAPSSSADELLAEFDL